MAKTRYLDEALVAKTPAGSAGITVGQERKVAKKPVIGNLQEYRKASPGAFILTLERKLASVGAESTMQDVCELVEGSDFFSFLNDRCKDSVLLIAQAMHERNCRIMEILDDYQNWP